VKQTETKGELMILTQRRMEREPDKDGAREEADLKQRMGAIGTNTEFFKRVQSKRPTQ